MRLSDIVISGDKFIASGRLSENQRYRSLIVGTLNADSLAVEKFQVKNQREVFHAPSFLDYDISSNGEYAVFSRYDRFKRGRIAPSVSLINLKTNRSKILGEGAYPVVNDDGIVYFQRNDLSGNYIYRYDGKSSVFFNFTKNNQIGELKLHPSGELLAVSVFDEDRDFIVEIFCTKTSDIISSFLFNAMPQELLWFDTNKLMVSVENEVDFRIQLHAIDLDTNEITLYETPPFNVFPRKIVETEDAGLKAIGMNETQRGPLLLGHFNLIENTETTTREMSKNYYTRWLFTEPSNQIPDEIVPYRILESRKYKPLSQFRYRMGLILPWSDEVFLMGIFSEPLGKHTLMTAAYIPYNLDDLKEQLYYFLTYENRTLEPTITFSTFSTTWVAGMWGPDENEVDFVWNRYNVYDLSISQPITWTGMRYSSLNLGVGLTYYDMGLKEDSIDFIDRYSEEKLFLSRVDARYSYNRPWRNSTFHPVRLANFDVSYDFSDKNIGMIHNYTQFRAFSDIAYAPFINKTKYEFVKTIAMQNRSTYRVVGGDSDIKQFMPGVDDHEFITGWGGRPFFSRMYLRGYSDWLMGREMLSTQTDLRFKILDDVNFSVNWGFPWFSSHYLGFSVWHDYAKLSQITDGYRKRDGEYSQCNKRYFKMYGYEIQSQWNIFGIPTLHRFGQAFPIDKNDESAEYYMMEIPIRF
jgi:hypothetical protein